MIHEVDDALRTLIRRDALNGSDVEVVFDAPTKEWATRRNTPTLDVYLYDIREDPKRRQVGMMETRGEEGTVTSRQALPRFFKLSYLVTAWTQRPEDEHRLLSAVLACFLRFDLLPEEVLAGSLAGGSSPVGVFVALPPPEDRQISDVWSALGGELKPALDLVVVAPVDPARALPYGPPVREQPRFSIGAGGGHRETVSWAAGRGAGTRAHEFEPVEPPEEEVVAGAGREPRSRTPASLRAGVRSPAGTAPEGTAGDESSGNESSGDESSREPAGDDERPRYQPGRVFRIRGTTQR